MKKGDIYWVKDVPMANILGEFDFKSRPVVVISSEKTISTGIAQVLPITAKLNSGNQVPNHIFIDLKKTQLNVPSVILPEHICTVPTASFIKHSGNVGEDAVKLIEKSILLQLGID